MKRMLAVVACVVTLLGLAPAAFAQAPAPKVTLTGLFDQVTSGGRNIYDGNFARSGDTEWYSRTRFRPDFEFAVGRTKAVLGLEMDLTWGQCGANDGGFPGNVSGTNSGCKGGGNGGFDLNTDVGGMIELKWMYTEFDLTGKDSLMPFIPVSTVARLGAQPFATLANYKVAYANGDFAGVSTRTTFAPNFRLALAYVQVEEEIARTTVNRRGDDFAIIISPEFTPFKGLDIKPLYSYFYADGSTSGSARRTPANVVALNTTDEHRHTVGVDMRWRSGPFSLDPTVYYQFGELDNAGGVSADRSAWFFDVIGGWRLGPLLLEGRGVYTTGNKATDDLRTEDRNYFDPLDLDTGYWAGWSNIQALGVDYFNGGGGTLAGMSTGIGYDRYGRMGFALRATYSVTPALAFYVIGSPTWTEEKVDTDTTSGTGGRGAPTSAGDSRYIGTEADLGMTWRFAPNTVFDLVGAYLFAGEALDAVNANNSDARDAWTVAARVRLSF
jgi:hypothetical protein